MEVEQHRTSGLTELCVTIGRGFIPMWLLECEPNPELTENHGRQLKETPHQYEHRLCGRVGVGFALQFWGRWDKKFKLGLNFVYFLFYCGLWRLLSPPCPCYTLHPKRAPWGAQHDVSSSTQMEPQYDIGLMKEPMKCKGV